MLRRRWAHAAYAHSCAGVFTLRMLAAGLAAQQVSRRALVKGHDVMGIVYYQADFAALASPLVTIMQRLYFRSALQRMSCVMTPGCCQLSCLSASDLPTKLLLTGT